MALAVMASALPLATALGPPCAPHVFQLSTGQLGPGFADAWQVVSAPPGVTTTAFGVHAAAPWMAAPPGTARVTTNWNLNPGNPQAVAAPAGDWVFRYAFAPPCPGLPLGWAASASLNVCIAADDGFSLGVNGGPPLLAQASGAFGSASCHASNVPLVLGFNHVDIRVSNYASRVGLLAYGTVAT